MIPEYRSLSLITKEVLYDTIDFRLRNAILVPGFHDSQRDPGANALWNYIFFRAQNVFISFVVASHFPIMDVALFFCLIGLDKMAALSLVP